MAEPGRVVWGAGTPRTMRAHWMLHELELPYEARRVGSRTGETNTPEFNQLNPSEKIPVLQDGELVLSESAAIVNYLAQAYGAGKNMRPPAEPKERARYEQWCFFSMMELDANTLYIIRRHEDLKQVYGEAPNAVKTARECFARQALAAARRLAGPYALGECFCGVDVLLTTCLTGAVRREIEMPQTLHEYLARTTARPAYRSALQANQPGKTAAG
jgi:glutathione S-transferase